MSISHLIIWYEIDFLQKSKYSKKLESFFIDSAFLMRDKYVAMGKMCKKWIFFSTSF